MNNQNKAQEAYETPNVFELGKVEELTLGPRGGNLPDGGEDLFFFFIWPF